MAGETATDASFPLGYLERSYRLVALFIDRDYGLLRWAPVFLLAFVGVAMLYRSRRDQLSLAMPGLHAMQDAATMCAAALGAQLVVAGVPGPHDVRLLVPAPAHAGRAGAGGAAGGLGPAPAAAHRRRRWRC